MRLTLKLASYAVLPLALLLFAQWPLREWVQAGSRQANDAAQILFALYMAVAVTAATRGHTHLAAQHAASQGGLLARGRRWALLLCVGPWALFVLWSSAPVISASLSQWEKFGETLTPGYFLVKLALGLLLALVLLDGVGQVLPHRDRSA